MFGSKFLDSTVFFIALIGTIAAGVCYNGYKPYWLVIAILAYLLLLAAGSYFIGMNFYLRALNRIPLIQIKFDERKGMTMTARNKNIVLSFDDGPHQYLTAQTLDILKQEKIPALFFVIGKNIGGQEHLLKRMIAEGHQIGNHSMHHLSNFSIQKPTIIQEEIQQTNQLIEAASGKSTRLFRPPFGVTNPRVAKGIQLAEMNCIGWNLRSYDTIAKDEQKLMQSIIKKVRPGSIILLHDTQQITINMLPTLIRKLKERGFTFTTI